MLLSPVDDISRQPPQREVRPAQADQHKSPHHQYQSRNDEKLAQIRHFHHPKMRRLKPFETLQNPA